MVTHCAMSGRSRPPLSEKEGPFPSLSRRSHQLLRSGPTGNTDCRSGWPQEEAMQRTLFVFSVLIAAACIACDSKPAPGASPTLVPPPSQFSLHQTDSIPGNDGMLAYGEAGKVQVQYTLRSDIRVPPPGGPYGPITLPPEAMRPPLYRVVSCLSTDGATCVTDAAGQSVASD